MTILVGILERYIVSQDGDRSYKHAYNLQELKVGCEYVVPENEFFATPIDNIQLEVTTVAPVWNPTPPVIEIGEIM